jgi:hypothetical protein
MTRPDAFTAVNERWERLGLDRFSAPIVFGMDVDNMLAEENEGSESEMDQVTR